MPYCSKCRFELKKTDKFCPECGTPVAQSESRKQKSESRKQKSEVRKQKTEETTDDYKTQVRGKQAYGVLNLENLPEGQLIDDRYEIKEKVGQGGFGAVYRVFDKTMETEKALKIIPEAIVSDKEAMFDLQSEAKTMIALNHPNIVRVYDFHKTGSIKFIDMEYVDGKTLTEIKLEYPNKQMPEEIVKEYALKITEGMAYAHNNNVLHKDIKPQNIKVTSKGETKIMDFGIAETVRTSMSRIQNTSSSGTLVYMSPEQIKGKDVGKESDIYSFGAMLYELLSGHPPFYKGAIEHQVLNKKPKPLDFISDSLNQLIMKCLQKSYKDRYHDFSEISEFLEKSSIHIKKNKENNNDKVDPENMILVEGGTFQMGSKDGYRDEKPVHTVKINYFSIRKYPITQREWEKVMGNNPSKFKGDNRPVENVSWYDVVEFCNKKSKADGLEKCYSSRGKNIKCDFSKNGYRLPTEAEWEFAARGGNKSQDYKYAGSNNIEEVAWYDENSGSKIHPVGQKEGNELDIYDMSGNVWEWCWDCYDENYYTISSSNNPKGPNNRKSRVLRGGSWSFLSACRVAFRGYDNPANCISGNGVRIVKSEE